MKTSSLITLVIFVSLSACSTQTALLNGKGGVLTKDEMQTFFVSGLGQTQTIDAAATCGGAEKVVKVERSHSALNWFLGLLTFSIYTPYDARVYCNIQK